MTGYRIQPKTHLKDLELRQAKRGQDRLIKLRDERREAERLERIANRVPKDRGTATWARSSATSIGGEGNGAARRSGLGFREDQAAVSALGAVDAALVAAHRHLARSRAAPVHPRTALEGAFDAEDPGVEINVAPEQAERLALAEPE